MPMQSRLVFKGTIFKDFKIANSGMICAGNYHKHTLRWKNDWIGWPFKTAVSLGILTAPWMTIGSNGWACRMKELRLNAITQRMKTKEYQANKTHTYRYRNQYQLYPIYCVVRICSTDSQPSADSFVGCKRNGLAWHNPHQSWSDTFP